jgi:uncharacterized phage protein (TIGR01671 family)
MREIKFRVVEPESGKIIGYERLKDGPENYMCWQFSTDGLRWTNGVVQSQDYLRVQFTGLHDKNDREIYEFDIVRIRFHEAPDGESFDDGVIRWHESSAAFKWFSGEPSDSFNYWLNQADGLGREIIGNTIDNPELLGGGV